MEFRRCFDKRNVAAASVRRYRGISTPLSAYLPGKKCAFFFTCISLRPLLAGARPAVVPKWRTLQQARRDTGKKFERRKR